MPVTEELVHLRERIDRVDDELVATLTARKLWTLLVEETCRFEEYLLAAKDRPRGERTTQPEG